MIVRDPKSKAIIQHPLDLNSWGDSARSTGMMALFGSGVDQDILEMFEFPKYSGLLTRHWQHYDDSCFTRDQLLCMVGGLWASRKTMLARRVFWSHFRRGFFCQNYKTQFERRDKGFWGRDPLSPSHIGHLIIASRLVIFYPFLFIAYPWMILEIIWHSRVYPRSEPNQLISMLMTYDLVWLWVFLHPNWRKSIHLYWTESFRDQKEIADFIIEGIEYELSKEI